MPTYPYRCKDCGHAFEAVQSFTDDALTECPECGGGLRKVYSSVGVVFKGSGFYKTDSRSSSNSGTSSSGTSSSSTTSETSSTGTAKSDSTASSNSGNASSTASTSSSD